MSLIKMAPRLDLGLVGRVSTWTTSATKTWKLNYAITDIILLHTTDKEVRTSKEKGVKGMCLDIVQPICRAAGQLPNASTCSWC